MDEKIPLEIINLRLEFEIAVKQTFRSVSDIDWSIPSNPKATSASGPFNLFSEWKIFNLSKQSIVDRDRYATILSLVLGDKGLGIDYMFSTEGLGGLDIMGAAKKIEEMAISSIKVDIKELLKGNKDV